jgi:hypothetical protein
MLHKRRQQSRRELLAREPLLSGLRERIQAFTPGAYMNDGVSDSHLPIIVSHRSGLGIGRFSAAWLAFPAYYRLEAGIMKRLLNEPGVRWQDVALPLVLLFTGFLLMAFDWTGFVPLERIRNLWPMACILTGLVELAQPDAERHS